MRIKNSIPAVCCALLLTAMFASYCNTNTQPSTTATPPPDSFVQGAFQNHRDSVPPKDQYPNPLFVLSHDYPTTLPAVINQPWQKVLNGKPITKANTLAYMDILKQYVAPRVQPFFTDNKNWTAARNGWFQEPWMGAQREAILGTYLGNGNPAHMMRSLPEDEAGYALVLYDSTAGYTVGQIWGKTGQKVNLVNDAAQFKEGAVIVKFAFSNINAPEWNVMTGAQTFQVYDTIPTAADPRPGYHLRKVSFFQMDVIVKDSVAAPKTGWVYSTFVYDMNAAGDYWQKMVPLGAMWGNDPDVISPQQPPYPELQETMINPKAPPYSTETLGWGGRLSGPNDGAVAQTAYDIKTKQPYQNLRLSSCMSCHLPAQDTFNSFLLPGPFPSSDSLMVFTPGSPEWRRWFRDLWGNVPFDSGQVAMDYDMVMAFKSISAYEAAHATGQNKLLRSQFEQVRRFRRHNSKSQFWH